MTALSLFLLQVTSPSLASEVIGMPPITTPTYAKEFKKVIEAAAKGRQIFTVQVNFYFFILKYKIFFYITSLCIKISLHSVKTLFFMKKEKITVNYV